MRSSCGDTIISCWRGLLGLVTSSVIRRGTRWLSTILRFFCRSWRVGLGSSSMGEGSHVWFIMGISIICAGCRIMSLLGELCDLVNSCPTISFSVVRILESVVSHILCTVQES